MFTCKNGEDVYLFICCLVNFEKIQWIGSKTTYENLIELLKNEITIRKAFLNVTNEGELNQLVDAILLDIMTSMKMKK